MKTHVQKENNQETIQTVRDPKDGILKHTLPNPYEITVTQEEKKEEVLNAKIK